MLQVSRNNSLKIPKQIEIYEKKTNNVNDTIEIKKSIAIANDKKIDTKILEEKTEIEYKDF